MKLKTLTNYAHEIARRLRLQYTHTQTLNTNLVCLSNAKDNTVVALHDSAIVLTVQLVNEDILLINAIAEHSLGGYYKQMIETKSWDWNELSYRWHTDKMVSFVIKLKSWKTSETTSQEELPDLAVTHFQFGLINWGNVRQEEAFELDNAYEAMLYDEGYSQCEIDGTSSWVIGDEKWITVQDGEYVDIRTRKVIEDSFADFDLEKFKSETLAWFQREKLRREKLERKKLESERLVKENSGNSNEVDWDDIPF